MFSKKFCGKTWGIHYNQLYKTFRKVLSNWDGFENIATKIVSVEVDFHQNLVNNLSFLF